MAINNFLRDVWAAAMLENFRQMTVWSHLGTRAYEQEFLGARQVKINDVSLDSVTVKDYVRNEDIDDPEELNDNQIAISMDQQKYFNFQVDDIDAAQTNAALVAGGTLVAIEAIVRVVEQDIADTVIAAIPDENVFVLDTQFKADSANVLGIPLPGSDLDRQLIDQFTAINVRMNQANVPKDSRWAVHSPITQGGITHSISSQTEPTEITLGMSRDVLENGFTGRLHDIEHFVSNTRPVKAAAGGAGFTQTFGGDVQVQDSAQGPKELAIVVGADGAFATASQVEDLIAYQPAKRFADALRGLYVYGNRVLRPEMMYVIKFTVDTP